MMTTVRAILGSHLQRWPRASGLLAPVALAWIVAGCGAASGPGANPTATARATATTPAATCASVLPGSSATDLATHGFKYPMAYPADTVNATISVTTSGPGLFTVSQFVACTPATTVSAVQSFYSAQLPALLHGWYKATLFPADGGLLTACSAPCFWNPKGGDIYYLVFDQFSDHGNGVVTYRGRWAAFDISTLPTCNANFSAANTAAQRMVDFVGSGDTAFPIPPLSSITPDDASGGLRGYDICSPGTVASVTTFLAKEVPADGWTKITTSDARCINTANCWTKNGQVWSWGAISDPTLWMISYRHI